MSGGQRRQQVRLLRLGGQPRGGTSPLDVHHHQGDLRHPGQAQPLGHQREARTRCGGHRLLAGVPGTHHGGDSLDLRADLVGELPRPHQVLLHEDQDGSGGGDGIADVELQAGRQRAQGEGVIALDQNLVVIGLLGRPHVSDGRLLRHVLPAQVQGLQVGLDDGVPSLEPDLHEVGEVLLGHVDQVGQGAHEDHVGRTGLARPFRQRVEGNADGPEALPVGLYSGVVEDHAAVPHLGAVLLVGLVIECHQDVDVVTGAQDGVRGDARLGPGGAPQDLRREGGEGEDVVAHRGGGPGQHLRGRDHSLATLSRKPDDDFLWPVGHLAPPVSPQRRFSVHRSANTQHAPGTSRPGFTIPAPPRGVKRCIRLRGWWYPYFLDA